MTKKVLAIVGSYRKGGIIDQAVEVMLEAAARKGAETEKIYLIDQKIEFCTNCRACGKTGQDQRRGQCVIKDDMNTILDKIDAADTLILASPINFSTVTALTKRLIERLIVYTYWPAENLAPKNRIKKADKTAVVMTSSTCPAFIGRFQMPNSLQILKSAAKLIGAKIERSLYFGLVCRNEKKFLSKRHARMAKTAIH